ncbi:MAG: hypothetical protein ACRCYY_14600 [Trueperaceae bacterium]
MKRFIVLLTLLCFTLAFAQDKTQTQDATQNQTTTQDNAKVTETTETELSEDAFDFVQLSEEFETISTETYYLATVENSGVDGYVQISEVIEGGTKLIVSMNNTLSDYRYGTVLYEGDCGPDRPEVLRLGDINNSSGDPNTSITQSELSFQDLTTGDYFMYVFAGEPGTQILACGEVGEGANRMQ